MSLSKQCHKCHITKTHSRFSKCVSNKDGLQNRCKLCVKEHRKTTAISRKAYDQKYYQLNITAKKEYAKKYKQSERGKLSNKKSFEKYRKSDYGRLVIKALDKRKYQLKKQRLLKQGVK